MPTGILTLPLGSLPLEWGEESDGVSARKARCGKRSTGQRVRVRVNDNNAWDCEAAGLRARAGEAPPSHCPYRSNVIGNETLNKDEGDIRVVTNMRAFVQQNLAARDLICRENTALDASYNAAAGNENCGENS